MYKLIKRINKWIKENMGDLFILTGLIMLPTTTFFYNVMLGFYCLAVVLMIIGFLFIKGGDD